MPHVALELSGVFLELSDEGLRVRSHLILELEDLTIDLWNSRRAFSGGGGEGDGLAHGSQASDHKLCLHRFFKGCCVQDIFCFKLSFSWAI